MGHPPQERQLLKPQGMDAADGIRQRTWKRYPRWARLMFILSVVAGLLYTLRHPLLRALGDHLIVEDPITRADAVLILGGSAMDRGSEAARLYADSVSKRFVFTGAPVPNDLRALGIDSTEARCTRAIAVERAPDVSSALSAGETSRGAVPSPPSSRTTFSPSTRRMAFFAKG